jgi:hypothetical protein
MAGQPPGQMPVQGMHQGSPGADGANWGVHHPGNEYGK